MDNAKVIQVIVTTFGCMLIVVFTLPIIFKIKNK